MAGILNVDTLKADSNLKLQIASANVAFIDANGLTIVGNSLNVGGGRIVVTSNNSISTPTVIGANLVTATGTTALGITANGQITTANAPFILTGGQLQFPATQIASGDGNCLDDYEEGTWTPTYEAFTSNPSVTYSTQAAAYTKVGRVVSVNGRLRISAVSSTGSGTLFIAGLPFTTATGGGGNLQNAGCIGTAFNWATTTNGAPDGLSADDNVSKMVLRVYKNDAGKVSGWSSAEAGDLQADATVDFQMTYQTS